VARIVADLGPIEVLVNNAGITRDTMLHRMDAEKWGAVIRTNLDSAYNLTRSVIEGMRARGWGRIVSISSINGQKGQLGQANYAAAKAGLVGLTKAVAREVASRNVTVNALAPGYIVTSMVEEIPEDKQEQILARIPMGRFGTPEDVAEAVLFLSSDGASYITGQVLTIDGGMIA